MRDRLIELLQAPIPLTDGISVFGEKRLTCSDCNFLADHLIENGVICPPCKVGNTVYLVGTITKQIVKAKVIYFGWHEDDMWLACTNGVAVSVKEQLGKTVFLTKEAAEKALRGEGE